MLGRTPSCQPQLDMRSSTLGSWAMTVIGTTWLAPRPETIGRGLVVAVHDDHQVLVMGRPHELRDGVSEYWMDFP